MNVEILNAKLARMYQQGKLARKYGPDVATAFEDLLALLLAITTEHDLYTFKGARPEKLQGRGEERSLRLNRQFRLVYTDSEKFVCISRTFPSTRRGSDSKRLARN